MNLYEFAERKEIDVDFFPLPLTESCAFEENGKCYVGMDPNLRGSAEAEHLAHEIGHCVYGGFYNRYSKCDVVGRSERRADKWAFRQLCPLEKLRKAIGDPWDIAEELGVSMEFLTRAWNFYTEAGVL